MGKHVKHYNIYTARAEFNKNVKNSHKLQQNVKYVDCTVVQCWQGVGKQFLELLYQFSGKTLQCFVNIKIT